VSQRLCKRYLRLYIGCRPPIGRHRRSGLHRRFRRLPLLRRCPRRCAPPFKDCADGCGLLVPNRAHGGGDVARRKPCARCREPRAQPFLVSSPRPSSTANPAKDRGRAVDNPRRVRRSLNSPPVFLRLAAPCSKSPARTADIRRFHSGGVPRHLPTVGRARRGQPISSFW
jgi:hypothetical protein